VRLADALFRRGHLSEQALTDVYLTGDRPEHLDRCDLCAERAVELGRWLDDLRTLAVDEADAAFPAERLAAQETQILRRLEQLDRPARVIAFPAQGRYDRMEMNGRGIRPAWVGIAAAAGLVLGVFGSQVGERFIGRQVDLPSPPRVEESAVAPVPVMTAQNDPLPASLQDLDENGRLVLPAFEALETLTPHIVDTSQHVVLRAGKK
jgi:hypothetical protein